MTIHIKREDYFNPAFVHLLKDLRIIRAGALWVDVVGDNYDKTQMINAGMKVA